MIRRIILENFMAHRHTVIEPADGLTVLIGPNNCGKSAVIHALEMICYNFDATDYAIRHGQKKATVTVETEDEDGTKHTIIWQRKKGTASYSIDGREISGRGVPHDLHQYLRMPAIEPSAGAEAFYVHFGLQKSPIFLLNAKASDAAQFFATSSDADKLFEMQKKHTQKAAAAKRERERLDREMEQLDSQLQILAPLSEMSTRLAALESEHCGLGDQQAKTAAMVAEIDRLAQVQTAASLESAIVDALASLQAMPVIVDVGPLALLCRSIAQTQLHSAAQSARRDVLEPLTTPPDLLATADLGLLCRTLDQFQRRQQRDAETSASLAPLGKPPDLHPAASLAAAIANQESSQANADRWLVRKQSLQSLAAPPELPETAPLQKMLAAMAAAKAVLRRDESVRLALLPLAASPQMIDRAPLADMISNLDNARTRSDLRRAELKAAESKLTTQRQRIEQWVSENPECQTCGQPISAELILGGEHAHE